MAALDGLIACAGGWRGTNQLYESPAGPSQDSPSALAVAAILSGRFVRVQYTWAYRGRPQEGELVVGHEAQSDVVTAYWVDSWHMGDKGMTCRGALGEDGALSVRGSYAAPPGPDWGWRIDIAPADGGRLRVAMYNIWPEGKEDLAVKAEYSRG